MSISKRLLLRLLGAAIEIASHKPAAGSPPARTCLSTQVDSRTKALAGAVSTASYPKMALHGFEG